MSSLPNIDPDEDLKNVTELESLCFNCHKNGTTRMLYTKIPHFREIIVMSFDCPHCNFHHSGLEPAAELGAKAVRYELKVPKVEENSTERGQQVKARSADMNRQVIRSEYVSIRIPEIDFEISPLAKKGEINTVEGLLRNAIDALSGSQWARREAIEKSNTDEEKQQNQTVYDGVDRVVSGLKNLVDGNESFTLILDDVAGNSFLENPEAPKKDPRCEIHFSERTVEQLKALGYAPEEDEEENEQPQLQQQDEKKLNDVAEIDDTAAALASDVSKLEVSDEILAKLDTFINVSDRAANLPGTCHACHRPCMTRMAVTEIPHFKDVVIMCTQCDWCGFRDAEVKPAGKIGKYAVKITLKIENAEDMKRDVMKSDSAACYIPEMDLELSEGTLGGKYTTIEGLLNDIKTQLEKNNAFILGDSSEDDTKSKFSVWLEKFDKLINQHQSGSITQPFHLILDDALGNSYIYNPHAPNDDPQMKVHKYERTFEQNEELGINDINTDHYLDDEQQELVHNLQQQTENNKLNLDENDEKGKKDEELTTDEKKKLKEELIQKRNEDKQTVYKYGALIAESEHQFDEDEDKVESDSERKVSSASAEQKPHL